MIKIYVTSYLKPEFIRIQNEQLRKNCSDDYELIVINNGISRVISEKIIESCKNFRLKCIDVNRSHDQFCSQSHCTAIEQAFRNFILNDDKSNVTVIMDDDVFPFKKFSFVDILNGNKLGGMYQQRNYENLDCEYLSAIFTLFENSIDFSKFSFFNGVADTGSATSDLMKKYSTTLVNHTAAIDIELDYVFKNKNVSEPYLPEYRCQFIAESFIHYYRGSNWSERDQTYHYKKFKFLTNFLSNPEKYEIQLDQYVSYDKAHSDKGYNGVDHNYRNYRFFDQVK